MLLSAAVSRPLLGFRVGATSGEALRLEANHWMSAQEIRNPDAMARLIAPGFSD
jgi:hypothetical protein